MKTRLRAATLGLSFALVSLSIAETFPRYAGEDPIKETTKATRPASALPPGTNVMVVGPFVGTHSETWESFGGGYLTDGTPILGGIATIFGTSLVVTRNFIMCSVIGRPSDGEFLMNSDRYSGLFTISFSEPVSAFGAYWGSGLNCSLCCGFDDSPSLLTFKDANGNTIGTDSFFYKGDGALEWRGYSFATPVKTITRIAEDDMEGFAIDGLQANVSQSNSVPNSLSNISTRGFIQTDNNVLIGGLIVSGTGPKKILLRALGPSLGQPPFNLPNALANPTLDLFQGQTVIASNDDWGAAPNEQAIAGTGLAPSNTLESAILLDLNPGSYTAVLRGVNSTMGNALFDAYDLGSVAGSKFGDISTRGFVQTGDNVMFAGTIVNGPDPQHILIRALGPTLGQPPFNLPNSLPDPFLDLRDANGNQITTNDNWKSTQKAEIQNTGLAPPNDSESAIAITLAPGAYTAIVTGVSNSTGNALVELYDLD